MHIIIRRFIFAVIFFTAGVVVEDLSAAPISDSLLIEGYYMQQGQSISRRQVEKFLLLQPYEIAQLADKSKAYSVSAIAVGGPMWCITTGITIWEVMDVVDAIKKQDERALVTLAYKVNNIAIPLFIGSEITLFLQNSLSHHSEYLLHSAVKKYDSLVSSKYNENVIFDHHIKEVRGGWYMQDRLLMPTSVLYSVLKEKEVSHGAANGSIFCKELAFHAGLIGTLFVTDAIAKYIMNYENNQKFNIWNADFGIGIGLELLATISSIISGGIRDKAIEKYNESLPQAPKPFQFFDPIPAAPVQQE